MSQNGEVFVNFLQNKRNSNIFFETLECLLFVQEVRRTSTSFFETFNRSRKILNAFCNIDLKLKFRRVSGDFTRFRLFYKLLTFKKTPLRD